MRRQTRDGKNMSFCKSNNCAHCCIAADVPLIKEDIDRITSMGYYDVYFVVDHEGLQVMRKLDGKCIFFKEGVCEIHDRRPLRCQYYPMTYDYEHNCAEVQNDCRFKNLYEITMTGNKRMMDYVDKLHYEFDLRSGNGSKNIKKVECESFVVIDK